MDQLANDNSDALESLIMAFKLDWAIVNIINCYVRIPDTMTTGKRTWFGSLIILNLHKCFPNLRLNDHTF